jgi:hypothetical protein
MGIEIQQEMVEKHKRSLAIIRFDRYPAEFVSDAQKSSVEIYL